MKPNTPTTQTPSDWSDLDKKREAYRRFIKYLRNHRSEIEICVSNPDYARDVFQREGQIEVPPEVKIVLLPQGDSTRHGDSGGSAVIEVLPDSVDPDSTKALEFFQCTYKIWSGATPSAS